MLVHKLKEHAIALLAFLIISLAFCMPVLSGKVLNANDLVLGEVLKKSAKDYNEKTGEVVHWTNSMFGGMPDTYGTPLANLFYKIPLWIGSTFLSGHYSWDTLLWFMISAYLLLYALGLRGAWAVAGSAAMTLSTFNVMGLEGGHIMKVLAGGCLPGVLAGLILLSKKKYTEGSILTIFYMNCMLSLNHTQITYYMLMMIILYCVIFGIIELVKKEFKHVMMVAAIIAGITAISAVANYNLLNVVISAKETIRSGKSELVKPGETAKEGLDKDYATSWSNGKAEIFTWLIPNFVGGSSQDNLLENQEGETMKALQSHGNEANQYAQRAGSAYWGEQNFVSGGVYLGAIVFFLFILGIVSVKDPMKWALLGVGAFFLLLSFGRNLSAFTDIAFNYFPMYNKFRVPSMCLSVVQLIVGVFAFWGVKDLLDSKEDTKAKLRSLYIAGGITGGLLITLILLGKAFFPFASDIERLGDASRNIQALPAWLLDGMKADRFALMRSDAIRSLFIVALGFGLVWAAITNKLKAQYALIAIGLIAVIDLWNVDKRYLNDDDFKEEADFSQNFTPSPADQQIASDRGDFRVFNVFNAGYGPNPFNDAVTSYHHQSIGGYHPAKLRRYQEMIENQISRGNQAVMNMLNSKYYIGGDRNSGPMVQMNPGALGNAWFVRSIKKVKGGWEEMQALNFDEKNQWDPGAEAVVQEKYAESISSSVPAYDSTAGIKEIQKDVHHVKYEVNSKTGGFAVFSEIYYQLEDGDGWKAKIDGKDVPVVKTDYILRGLMIPAGAKSVEFYYDSSQFDKRNKISFFTSLILGISILALLFLYYRNIAAMPAPVVTATPRAEKPKEVPKTGTTKKK